MYAVYQNCDRFAAPAVSAWLCTHKIDAGRRYRDLDNAMIKVCEQVAGICANVGLNSGEPTTRRSDNGSITVRYDALHVVFNIRRI